MLANLPGWVQSFSNWATGASTPGGGYMRLIDCMGGDYFWITLTVGLDLAVATGYIIIAYHWWDNSRRGGVDEAAGRALLNMRNIFVFCGICGYLFIPIKMFWPAWRVYDIFMMGLVFYTWRYAWNAHELRVIYTELGSSAQLRKDLADSKAESRRKSFFLNAISHDLRTPLNGIVLQSHMAEMCLKNGDSEMMMRAINEIKASAKTTADVLDALLQFARLESDEPKLGVVRLGDILEQVSASLQSAARQKQLTVGTVGPRDLNVRTDRAKLERVLLNLVENGIKYTSTGGVTVEATVNGENLALAVADTGAGVPEEQRERIFQEFVQLHNSERDRTKGVGLGLAIARRLVGQLGGTLTLDAAYTRGARFVIVLPGVIISTRDGVAVPELVAAV